MTYRQTDSKIIYDYVVPTLRRRLCVFGAQVDGAFHTHLLPAQQQRVLAKVLCTCCVDINPPYTLTYYNFSSVCWPYICVCVLDAARVPA